MTPKEHAIAAAKDLAIGYTYYDRKQDEDFDRDALADLVNSGELTPDEVIAAFSKELRERWLTL